MNTKVVWVAALAVSLMACCPRDKKTEQASWHPEYAREWHDHGGRMGPGHGPGDGANGGPGHGLGGPGEGPHGGPGGKPDGELQPEGADMVGMFLYPPNLVLRFGDEIGVAPETMSKIRVDYFETQERQTDLRPRVVKAHLEIQRLLAAGDFDESKLAVQIDEVAKGEAETKKQQFALMLRIRQLLTPDQRKKLDALKGPKPPPPMGPGSNPPPAGAPAPTAPGKK